jgi:hypothetical protein
VQDPLLAGRAAALKVSATAHVQPVLRVVAELSGEAVSGARVRLTLGPVSELGDGGDGPVRTFGLERDGQYMVELNYEADGRRYRAEPASVTADWRGLREVRMMMKEVLMPGRDWTSPATGMEFVWIAAVNGWVGKYEVTNAEYRKMKSSHNSGEFRGHSLNGDRQPVVEVNFAEAKAYAAWLTEQDRAVLGGARYRLPTEQEFMTYAQCGDGREYPWGNQWPPPSGRAGNYSDRISGYTSGFPVTAEVDKLWRNPWGLYGVGGNVWEACASNTAADQSWGGWRGASWNNFHQDSLRCSSRYDVGASTRYDAYGFRVVLSR